MFQNLADKHVVKARDGAGQNQAAGGFVLLAQFRDDFGQLIDRAENINAVDGTPRAFGILADNADDVIGGLRVRADRTHENICVVSCADQQNIHAPRART